MILGLAAVSAGNIYADYHSTVLGDQPVAYYPVNSSVDPAGFTATDLSGNGNNAISAGAPQQFYRIEPLP